MDQAWISKRQREFEEAKFPQAGHGQESPEMFLQRRIWLHMILFKDTNGAMVIERILQTQPKVWSAHLSNKIQNSIYNLLMAVSNLEKSLISLYQLTKVADFSTKRNSSGMPMP